MHNHLWQMVERLDLTPADCVGQTSPITVDLAIWQFLAPLLVGGRVRVVPEPGALSAKHLLDQVRRHGVTMFEIMPALAGALLNAGLGEDPGALRAVIVTGDPLTRDLPDRWCRAVPAVALYNAYGATECTDDVSIALSAWGDRTRPTALIGGPLANSSMLVLDEQLQPVPVGAPGMVFVGGAGVARGYLGNPRKTALSYVPHPWADEPGARLYRMGDLARPTPSGEVEFLGRGDGQVKIRGLRIDTLEVEAVLRACPGVAEAAVRVHEGPAGAFLVGYAAFRDGSAVGESDAWRVLGPDEDRWLRARLLEFLPRHMVPTVFVALPRLPRTVTDKIDYRALEYTGPDPSAGDADMAPDDPTAAAVQAVWADTLGVPAVAWTDSFFQLGGHSLAAVGMVERVRELLGSDVDLAALYAAPRLDEFVDAVRRAHQPVTERIPVAPGTPVPASAAQQRFWFLREVRPGDAAYNMPGVLHLSGDLDEDTLQDALREVLGRHHVLCSRFTADEGELSWIPGDPADFELPRLDLRGAVAEFGDAVFDRIAAEQAERPADLRHEIPFRATLARLEDREWRLAVTVDHIACDGWSLSVFLEDLAAAYNRRPLPAPGYTFADYCHEEQAYLRRLDRSTLEALWRVEPDERLVLAPAAA
jgi:hypothetical protein